MGLFVQRTDDEIYRRRSAIAAIVGEATDSNSDIIQELSDTTDALIERITIARESSETSLSAFQDASHDEQEDERARIENSIEDLKAELLAELQALKDAMQAKAWGRYDPRPLWDAIEAAIDRYHDADAAARAEFAGMQATTDAEWTAEADSHDAAYEAELRQKEVDWQNASDAAAAAWAAALARARSKYAADREQSLADIAAWRAEKENNLNVRYNALYASISNIYDLHYQHTTFAALDAAKEEADAECAARYDFLSDVDNKFNLSFEKSMAAQQARHEKEQQIHNDECDAAVDFNESTWDAFSAESRAVFDEFQGDENTGFHANMDSWSVAFHNGVAGIKRGPHVAYGRYSRYLKG